MAFQNQVADVDLGYRQYAAGAADAAVLASSLFPGAVFPPGTRMVTMIPEVQAIRWRSDGTAPTTAVGYPLAAGAELRFTSAQLPNLRIIASTAGAVVNVYAWG